MSSTIRAATPIPVNQTIAPKTKSQVTRYLLAFFELGTIHGSGHLSKSELTLIEKCIWIAILTVSFAFSCYVSFLTIDHFRMQNTVISLERDYYYRNTTLPGVTVCPMKRLNYKIYERYANIHNITGQQKWEFFQFLESLANSTYRNFNSIRHYPSTDEILERLQIYPEHYMQLIYNLTSDNIFNGLDNREFHELLQDAEINVCQSGEDVIATRQVLTEFGLCFMTNTFLSDKYTASYFITGNRPARNETWWRDVLKVQRSSYFHTDVTYAFRGNGHNTSYMIYLHSAYEVMDIDRNLGSASTPTHASVSVIEIVVEQDYEKETLISQRKCRFMHESNLTHFPIYTKNLCIQQCRLDFVYKICNCIPHFYPNRVANPKPICSYKDLMGCVANHEEHFRNFYGLQKSDTNNFKEMIHFECACLQNCEDAIINLLDFYLIGDAGVIMGDNTVEVTLTRLPTSRLKRQVIFTFTNLLVAIGGAIGLFLGFSVLGAVEIVYHFTIRLIWYLCGYRN